MQKEWQGIKHLLISQTMFEFFNGDARTLYQSLASR